MAVSRFRPLTFVRASLRGFGSRAGREVATGDPHLEEVIPYSAIGRRAPVAELAPMLGGFVAALALMPGRWLVMTALFFGATATAGLVQYISWRRKLRRRLAAAPAPPPGSVEVRTSRRRGGAVRFVVLGPAVLLGAAWLASAMERAPFAWGLLSAATLVGTGLAGDLVELWTVRRWERRNGRVLTSLLLGDGDVFYVERGTRAV